MPAKDERRPFRPHRPISADRLNETDRLARRAAKLRVEAPLELVQLPGGPCLRLAAAGGTLRYAKTGGGGIPAATGTQPNMTLGSASCTLCDSSGTTVTNADSQTVYNPVGTAVAGNKLIIVGLVDDQWTIVLEPC